MKTTRRKRFLASSPVRVRTIASNLIFAVCLVATAYRATAADRVLLDRSFDLESIIVQDATVSETGTADGRSLRVVTGTCLDRLTRTAVEELGAEHPRMLRIRTTFVAFREKFAAHLREETEELFPLIRQLTTGEKGNFPRVQF